MRTADPLDYPGRRESPERVIPGHRPITRAKEQVSESPGNRSNTSYSDIGITGTSPPPQNCSPWPQDAWEVLTGGAP